MWPINPDYQRDKVNVDDPGVDDNFTLKNRYVDLETRCPDMFSKKNNKSTLYVRIRTYVCVCMRDVLE